MTMTARLATAPELSILIASVNGWEVLAPTLAAIDALPERDRIEVVVVEAVGGETRSKLMAHQPAVVVVPSERLPIPRLRYLATQKALGKVVAIIEDHAEVEPDWASAMLAAHDDPDVGAVGGTVENGRSGWVNWSVFFCEYTPYMNPVPEGPADDLPGNNISYKRPHLLRHAKVLDDGKWESWINDRLRMDGVATVSTNLAVVRHIKPFRLDYFLVQRFHFAKSYAGMRRVDQSWGRRLIYGIGSMALPGLLLARVARNALAKKRHLARFAACLPLIALFLTVGAVGEMVGYLAGAGTSLDRVE